MEAETANDDDRETPGDCWISLDRKLDAALTRVSEGELGCQLTLTSKAALSNGRAARGRVLLTHDIYHLQRNVLHGGNTEGFCFKQ